MSDDVRNNDSFSLPCISSSCLKNEEGKHFKATENHVSNLVEEMIEVTCKNLSKQVETVSNIADNLKKIDRCKSEKTSNVNGENDTPVRRSNRIRRSVVKKDEFISPRSKKSNKTKSSTLEASNTDSNNNPNEMLSKTNPDKSLSSKGQKLQKEEKKQKGLQVNSKRSAQPEKKKTTRKKKCTKNEDVSSNNINYECESKKCEIPDTSSELLATSDHKHPDTDINTECNKVNNIALSKANEEQNCEVNDKSSESCNIKPVKVKSRWWRSSELEAVKNSKSVNTDSTVTSCINKIETSDSPLTIPVQMAATVISVKMELNDSLLIPTVQIKDEVSEEPKLEEKKHDTTEDTKPPPYDHIEENIYRFER